MSSLQGPSFPRLAHGPVVVVLAVALAGCSENAKPRVAVETKAVGPEPEATSSAGTARAAPADPLPAARPPEPPAPKDEPREHAPTPPGDRIYSKARFAWIQAEPRYSPGWLGYLGLGGSVRVRGGSLEKAKVPNSAGQSGCEAWYAVEPTGYVCAGDSATVNPNDPVVVALAADAPKTDSPWPYEYGESLGAPRYARIPTPLAQKQSEWDLDAHEKLVEKARAGEAVSELAGVDLAPASPGRWGDLPDAAALPELSPLVRESRKWIANGSTVAYTRSFELGGRTFVITHDHAIVPRDRIRPYPRSSFEGVPLGGETALPIAFFRKGDRPKYRREEGGAFTPTGASWPRLAWVALTGDEAKDGQRTFFATREPGIWVLDADATIARAAAGAPATVRALKSGRKTWVDISVLGGTMVAYEDDRPVFATLISPGRGGIPSHGVDPLETASTPTGTFRVDGKFVTATMVSSTNDLLVHTEVEYVLNFHGPHALHAAYWHDAWGDKKSGGCVNLSPIDAKRMFAWTEPAVPEGWYGMRSVPEMGPATVVVVHR